MMRALFYFSTEHWKTRILVFFSIILGIFAVFVKILEQQADFYEILMGGSMCWTMKFARALHGSMFCSGYQFQNIRASGRASGDPPPKFLKIANFC